MTGASSNAPEVDRKSTEHAKENRKKKMKSLTSLTFDRVRH
jgi:hypothetical protein